MARVVVAGVAETGVSSVAVSWAGAEAVRRGAELHLLHAVDPPITTELLLGPMAGQVLERIDEFGTDELRVAADRVEQEFPGLVVRTELVHDHPRRALLRAASHAEIVVTGGRHREDPRSRTAPDLLLGSTGLFLAARAACPTAIVRAAEPPLAQGIVVGYDGSPASIAAVEFAAEEAAARSQLLRVVQAWQFAFEYSAVVAGAELDGVHRLERRQRLADLEAFVATLPERYGIRVEPVLEEGTPASAALTELAAAAQLLVVGSRGHGGFLAALLGSTSHAVLHRATVPVVVVHDPTHREVGTVDAVGAQRHVVPAGRP